MAKTPTTVPTAKPRNFVAKNMIASGAGKHKDKKKEAKQGNDKYKKMDYAESLEAQLQQSLAEARDPDTTDADYDDEDNKDHYRGNPGWDSDDEDVKKKEKDVKEVFGGDKETGTTSKGGVVKKSPSGKGITHTKTTWKDRHDTNPAPDDVNDHTHKYNPPSKNKYESKITGIATEGAAPDIRKIASQSYERGLAARLYEAIQQVQERDGREDDEGYSGRNGTVNKVDDEINRKWKAKQAAIAKNRAAKAEREKQASPEKTTSEGIGEENTTLIVVNLNRPGYIVKKITGSSFSNAKKLGIAWIHQQSDPDKYAVQFNDDSDRIIYPSFNEGVGDTIKRGVKKLTAPVKDPILDQMKDIAAASNKRTHDAQNKKYAPAATQEGIKDTINKGIKSVKRGLDK